MKQIYALLAALMLTVISAQAQITLYHENFSATVSGLTTTGAAWGSDNTTPNTGISSSGGSYYRTSTSTSAPLTKVLTLNNAISTLGFTSLAITWKDYRTQIYVSNNNGNGNGNGNGNQSTIANNALVRLSYSVDGINFTDVSIPSQGNTTYNTWKSINNGASIALPAGARNRTNVWFRWSISVNNTNGDYYAIDDITITGTPDDDLSTAEVDLSVLDWNARPKNENPFATGRVYAVDGNSVTFARTSDTGVGVTRAVVTDSLFQTSSKTLTIIQKGATNTRGTNLSVRFAEPVADLTFTLFDVDQASGQFQDRLVITGVGYSGEVVLAKTRVITTTKNQFTASGSFVRGTSGSDVPANSPDGNVKVTFDEPVGEVRIAYYNIDPTRNNEGQQGIAIHNLYWRKAQMMSVLPVELAYFSGQSQSGSAKLSWATAMELDNDRFVVERSQDGKAFSRIGEVKGSGNSSIVLKYSFTDTNPAAGTNYYRLRQVDFDGKEAFSKVVALEFSRQTGAAGASLAKVYPTLASDKVSISLASAGRVTINVLDATGKAVAEMAGVTDRELELPVQSLKSGVYFVSVTDGQSRETLRFVKR
ncbi:MAG: T9SS type A sorting domain-containing protein [Hymenobacteraceae bacterium]|nr:T9SS type A sorting domain-containing protein [Hymenobacteraceae bacterium]